MKYLIKNARAIFSQSHPNASDIRISDGVITELGEQLFPLDNETLIDASGCSIYPGLVNTHHHLAQSILKGVPAGLNQGLGDWLASVPYQYWPKITPELMYHAARLGLYELLRSGATTCADHHYLYHATSSPEVEAALWQAADELGIRLVLCRGSATERGTHRGLRDSGIEPESVEQVITRLEQSRSRYHQNINSLESGVAPMRQLVVAPTSLIRSTSRSDLVALADYARAQGLRLHSHLLEVDFDEQQAQAKYGMSAIDYAASCNWLGSDVWFAHLVKTDAHAIELLAQTKTGIAHCPTSNCRLGSGIAPVIAMQRSGVPISIGVDGSASAESASMLQELNLAWLLHRTQHGPAATNVEMVINWGSCNGAQILGLPNLGKLEVGYAADLVLYDLQQPRFAGVHSPLEAPLICGEPVTIKQSFVNGKLVVSDNQVHNIDLEKLTADVQQSVQALLRSVGA